MLVAPHPSTGEQAPNPLVPGVAIPAPAVPASGSGGGGGSGSSIGAPQQPPKQKRRTEPDPCLDLRARADRGIKWPGQHLPLHRLVAALGSH